MNHHHHHVERETEENTNESLEVPSCIESLTSSSQQLNRLTNVIGQYYIKTLLCYGYALEPNKTISRSSQSDQDKSKRFILVNKKLNLSNFQNDPESLRKLFRNEEMLESMESVRELLPFLNDLCLFIERCFATIESTFKRLTYYLNKAANRLSTNHLTTDDEFQLTPDSKLEPIFIALMDLIYALVNLDKVIETHTNICESLAEFRFICELVIEAQATNSQLLDEDVCLISTDCLKKLVESICSIQLTLGRESQSIFQLCIEHLNRWNLIIDKSQKGYKNLREQFERFILFSIENIQFDTDQAIHLVRYPQASICNHLIYSNMTPTVHLTGNMQMIFGITSLFVLYSKIFAKPERRIIQAITRLLQQPKTINLVQFRGSNCYLLIDEFLDKHSASSLLESKLLKQLRERSEQVFRLDLSQVFDRFSVKVIKWSVELKAQTLSNKPDEVDIDLLKKRLLQFQSGLILTEEMNSEIKNIMMIYLHCNKPMSKVNLINVLRLVSLVKSIEVNLVENRLSVHYCRMQIEKITRNRWVKLMDSARKRLISVRHSERKVDTTSALLLTSICSIYDYLTTYDGRIIMSLCLSMLIPSFDTNELSELNQLLNLVGDDIFERLATNADCGYLYWSYPTFGTYYNHAFEEDPCALDELNYFHLSLDDIPKMFTTRNLDDFSTLDFSWLLTKRDLFLGKLSEELMEQFKLDFLDKICQEFEIELRLQSHRDLQLDNNNPFRGHLYNFKQIFASSRSSNTTFRIFDQKISLRYHIEQHLNKTCYNLTSIAPHDWFTYDSMLNLARHRYEFKFANSLLPTQSLDYGLDLIDVTRNLALFVSKYGYDLVNQLFIEKCSNRISTSSASSTFSAGRMSMLSSFAPTTSNQLLNVLQVKHIEGSLQTHGYGLLDSSVNCTYQVLKRLINLLSRQLTDDKLRAILTRELQQFEQSSKSGASSQQCSMTFEKANKIAKQFKLSVHHQQMESVQAIGTDLDSLRQSITQIGNLLAFIRMLKNGALNCASKSVDHLPNMHDLSNLRLNKYLQGFVDSTTLKEACENFDQCLEDLEENFSSKTNYFNIIISLFGETLSAKSNLNVAKAVERREDGQSTSDYAEDFASDEITNNERQVTTDESNQTNSNHRLYHFKLFFLLVPALTINYIDHIMNCKERVTSRSSAARFGALISDDGFPMGIAFLLTVLNQTQDFARIEWFKQVRGKLDLYKNEVKQRIEDSRYEKSLKQTSSMTLGRLKRLAIEYVALDFTLGSALLFFRSCTLTASSSR